MSIKTQMELLPIPVQKVAKELGEWIMNHPPKHDGTLLQVYRTK